MDTSPRKQKGGATVGRANLEHIARMSSDGASSTSLASHLSFQQQRKRMKENMRDEELGSLNLHPTTASIPSPRRGFLPSSWERGLKRKIGCIDASTRPGRKRKLEKDYVLGSALGRGKFGLVRICKSRATGEELACKTGEELSHFVPCMKMQNLCIFRNGCYSKHRAANLIKELIMVIKYCHELGVVHRDIKPENILRTSTGELKLADFGLSTQAKPCLVWWEAPHILPLKFWQGHIQKKKVDVWGAGVLLHSLLIGILLFRGDSVQAIFEAINGVQLDFNFEEWKSISRLAKDLQSRMLSRDVEKRPSPQEVLGHPWIKFYTESKVTVPTSMSKKNSVKGVWSEESPLQLSPCKRERRGKFTNQFQQSMEEMSLSLGICRVSRIQSNQSLISKQQGNMTL